MATRVSSKLEESDYRGAVRLACSEDVIAEHNTHTLEDLRAKHPPPHPGSIIADMDYSAPLSFPIDIQIPVILKAIVSFPIGSKGGLDGLLPQHLKDLTGPTAGDGGVSLLSSLAGLITLILESKTPPAIRPLFFWCQFDSFNKEGWWDSPLSYGVYPQKTSFKMHLSTRLGVYPTTLVPKSTWVWDLRRCQDSGLCCPNLP